jgi:acetylornithine deacetylase/succinyl-diaminopimelate desuccinylase-like protein
MNIDWDRTGEQVVNTLQNLIRFDTTNPPGNETPCLEYIRDRLAAEGVDATLLESAPGRGNLVARLPGDGTERPLLLLSHVDVVPAEAEQWTHPPFAGTIADGHLWGRGAVDMKGLTAIELELFILLKRLNLPFKRDVILAATADEEAGGQYGVGWLVENHFDLIDAEYAINEGGGVGIKLGDHWAFLCQTAEKGICWTKLRARGEPGHASTPRGETAVGKLAGAVDRLAHARLPQHRVATVESLVHSLSQVLPSPLNQAILGLLDPELEPMILEQLPDQTMAALLRASLRNTATPTILRAGTKVNVIPSVAEAEVDCRLLPGQTADDAIAEMRTYVGDEIEIEIVRTSPGVESGYDTPLFHTISQVMSEFAPDSITVPFMVTGATDGRFLAAKGIQVYGFWPMKELPDGPKVFQMAHAHDERISLDNLHFGSRVLWEIIHRFCS